MQRIEKVKINKKIFFFLILFYKKFFFFLFLCENIKISTVQGNLQPITERATIKTAKNC